MAQLLSISDLINGTSGDPNKLKSIINIWSNISSILFTALVFILGRWVTTDWIWHIKENVNMSRLEAGWGLTPSIIAIWKGYKLKARFSLLMGILLFTIWVTSIGMSTWLTECVDISDRTYLDQDGIYTISRLQSMDDSDTPEWNIGSYPDVSGYGVQAMIGLENHTMLHYEDGEYYWSPWLKKNDANVSIKNINAFSVAPTCNLLNKSDVTLAYYDGYFVNITVVNSTFMDLRGSISWSMSTELLQYHWSTILDGEDAGDGYMTYNVLDRHNVYLIFGSDDENQAPIPPTFVPSKGYNPNVYIFKCSVAVTSWEVDGIINSIELDRLYINNKTKVSTRTEDIVYVESSIMGLHDATMRLTNSETIITPIQKWMSVTKSPKRQEWFSNITEAWLELKLSESIAYMMSPITLVDKTQNVTGNAILRTSILETKRSFIFAGVIVQIVVIVAVVLIYMLSVKKTIYRGDDIVQLISSSTDWELERLTTI
ncbi:hypothetical protein BGZ76_003074 [Entomortierella beljakovae]|nr:hypothetical protein BGZ76_003074 [Entomortierella beljakovae]